MSCTIDVFRPQNIANVNVTYCVQLSFSNVASSQKYDNTFHVSISRESHQPDSELHLATVVRSKPNIVKCANVLRILNHRS